ncbi:unnamed protein product [Schistosoma intercalatum]|nr:unnamed protein product [Schistosoma intercalatum]
MINCENSLRTKNNSQYRKDFLRKFRFDNSSWLFSCNNHKYKECSKKKMTLQFNEQLQIESTLNLLDNIDPDQLYCILTEVIHQLFNTSRFVWIQQLDSSKLELINNIGTFTIDHQHRNEWKTHSTGKSSTKSIHNETHNCIVFNLSNEAISYGNNVKSFVVKVNHIKNAQLRNLLLLNKDTIKKENYVVICIIHENGNSMNGILISFIVKTFLDSDRKSLEMFTVKLKTLNEVIKKYVMKSSMELQYNLQNNYSIPLGELNYPSLVRLSKDLLHQIIEKTNYTNCVLIFSTDESNQLLCIASSDELFTGQMKIDVEKPLFENNSHLFNDSTIQEIEQIDIIDIIQRLFNDKPLELLFQSNQKKFIFYHLGSFLKQNTILSNITTIDNDDNNPIVNVSIILCLWSICSIDYLTNENDLTIGSQKIHTEIIDLIDRYKEKLLITYKLQYFYDLKLFSDILHKETIRLSCIMNHRNLYENVADSLKKLINYDCISIYHFDKNEQEWIEELKQYPMEKQVVYKRRWNKSPWMFESLLKQNEINMDLRTLTIDSIDSIIKSINQLDLNVYLIHLFFHNNDPNHLTLIEFHKLNNNQRFSKYEKYLLSNYITDFLMIIMPQVYLNNELHIMRNRNEINSELVAYHMKISDNEIAQLINHKIHSLTQIHPNFNEISFLSRSVNERDSTAAIMIMFNNLGFIKQWNICQSKLACFILTIKNNYRQPTYHNWTHAFTVGHMAYLILTIERALIHQYLDEMEQLALFIGALCHDIDHRGFNNHYQTLIHSPLDAVYGYKGSILEHHHIDQTMRILNMKDCNILSQMTKIEYERFKLLLKHIILATDLYQHISIIPEFIQLSNVSYDPFNRRHHELLLSILVTSCDLNDQCKHWLNTLDTAKFIYYEFFHQGDLEKSYNTIPLLSSFDREKAFIPELQIHFIDSIVLPCFKILSKFLPKFQSTLYTIHKNKQIWQILFEKFKQNQLVNYTNDLLFNKYFNELIEAYL